MLQSVQIFYARQITHTNTTTGNVPKGLPYKLSEMWHTLKNKLEVLECYHFKGDIESVTPEIILQERSPENAVNRLIDSVKECADKITTKITLPKEHILHDPPVLIEMCSFISQNGKCTRGMPSAVREYSGKPIDPKNPGYLVRGALTIGEALANHAGERPYGILFRQYGQDYDKKVFRRSKSIPYKVFTAVLYINKDGTPL